MKTRFGIVLLALLLPLFTPSLSRGDLLNSFTDATTLADDDEFIFWYTTGSETKNAAWSVVKSQLMGTYYDSTDCTETGRPLAWDQALGKWECLATWSPKISLAENYILQGTSGGIAAAYAVTGDATLAAGVVSNVKVQQGAAPTISAAGNVGVDTTDDQLKYYGGAARALNYGHQIDFVVKDVDANTFFLLKARDPMTITSLDCIVTAGTSVVVTVNECSSTGTDCASGGISVTADADGAADTSFTDAAIDAGDWLQVVLSSESGVVTYVTCSLSYDDTAQ